MKTPTMLMILDGFGLNPDEYGNAIKQADTPNLDRIFSEYPFTSINASGGYVGLPDGQMGNSEVGHLNIGAGRIVYQELTNISKAVEDGRFFENPALNHAMDHVIENSAKDPEQALHLFGLMSDGGVHSHIDHIKAAIAMAKAKGVPNLFVHCFMDGRDVPPTSGINYIHDIENYMAKLQLGHIGMVSGRYYAMDRDKRWDRVKLAYECLTEPVLPGNISGKDAVLAAYGLEETDEFIQPRVCNGFDAIADGDAVIFANFRPDRAREITRAFVDPAFDGFERNVVLKDLCYVCMTTYDATIPNVLIAYPPKDLKNTLGEVLAAKGLTQLRIAETEKYAHVTFFFNGGVEQPYEGEDRILIPSPKVATYDLKPEMSAFEVADAVCKRIEENCPDFIILNFANCDMVGHTGVFEAAVKAVETVDTCVGKVCEAVQKAGGKLFITADHGNADEMLDEKGEVVTAHSTNPVPFIYCDYTGEAPRELAEGALCDIAPTMLDAAGIPQPADMTGKSLLR